MRGGTSRARRRPGRRLARAGLGVLLGLALGGGTALADEADPIVAADRDFAAAHGFAAQWIGEVLFSRDGAVVGDIADVALEGLTVSHLIVALDPTNGPAGKVAVPITIVETRVDLGTRRHVADAALVELRAPLR